MFDSLDTILAGFKKTREKLSRFFQRQDDIINANTSFMSDLSAENERRNAEKERAEKAIKNIDGLMGAT